MRALIVTSAHRMRSSWGAVDEVFLGSRRDGPLRNDDRVRAHDGPRWNHNTHFHRVVMEAIPERAVSALDVGAGDGLLAGELRTVLADVTGVDLDLDVLNRAAAGHPDIRWVHGDVMTFDFGRTFDVVASVATLHHLPHLTDALRRLADLTSPGGVLVVIGLARAASLRDHAMGVVGAVQHQWYSRTRNLWMHSAPTVWPPPHIYEEIRDRAAEILPGSRWKQYGMWRYAVIWQRPDAT